MNFNNLCGENQNRAYSVYEILRKVGTNSYVATPTIKMIALDAPISIRELNNIIRLAYYKKGEKVGDKPEDHLAIQGFKKSLKKEKIQFINEHIANKLPLAIEWNDKYIQKYIKEDPSMSNWISIINKTPIIENEEDSNSVPPPPVVVLPPAPTIVYPEDEEEDSGENEEEDSGENEEYYQGVLDLNMSNEDIFEEKQEEEDEVLPEEEEEEEQVEEEPVVVEGYEVVEEKDTDEKGNVSFSETENLAKEQEFIGTTRPEYTPESEKWQYGYPILNTLKNVAKNVGVVVPVNKEQEQFNLIAETPNMYIEEEEEKVFETLPPPVVDPYCRSTGEPLVVKEDIVAISDIDKDNFKKCLRMPFLSRKFCTDQLEAAKAKKTTSVENTYVVKEEDTVVNPLVSPFDDKFNDVTTDYFSGKTGTCNYKIDISGVTTHGCNNKSLSAQQRFVADFLSPKRVNHIKGLLVFHAPGTGKTQLSASIFSQFLKYTSGGHDSMAPTKRQEKVLFFVCKKELIENAVREFRRVRYEVFTGKPYVPTATEKETLDRLTDEKAKQSALYSFELAAVEQMLNKQIHIVTYTTMANRLAGKSSWDSHQLHVDSRTGRRTAGVRGDTNPDAPLLDNTLIIMDEFHNVNDPIGKPPMGFTSHHRNQLFTSMRRSVSAKLVFLTATPINNQVSELCILMNLCKPPMAGGERTITAKEVLHDPKKCPYFPQYIKPLKDRLFEYDYQKTLEEFHKLFVDPVTNNLINQHIFMFLVKGHVSYFNNVQDYTLFPKQLDEKYYYIEWSPLQMEKYREELNKLGPSIHTTDTKETNRKVASSGEEDEPSNQVVDLYTQLQRFSNAVEPRKLATYTEKQLKEHAPKLHFLIENVTTLAPEGKQLVYTSMTTNDFGINALSKAFPIGKKWKRLHLTEIKQMFRIGGAGKKKTYELDMKRYEILKYDPAAGKSVRYFVALFSTSGETIDNPTPQDKELIKTVFNQPKNIFGEYINCICLTYKYKEGVSFFGVRNYHFFDRPPTETDVEQALARGIRRCSHELLEYDKEWTIRSHWYFSVFPKKVITATTSFGGDSPSVMKKTAKRTKASPGVKKTAKRTKASPGVKKTAKETTAKRSAKKQAKTTPEETTKKVEAVRKPRGKKNEEVSAMCDDVPNCQSAFCYLNNGTCTELPIDLVVQRRSKMRYEFIYNIYRLLKASAVDCLLFQSVNDTKDITCFHVPEYLSMSGVEEIGRKEDPLNALMEEEGEVKEALFFEKEDVPTLQQKLDMLKSDPLDKVQVPCDQLSAELDCTVYKNCVWVNAMIPGLQGRCKEIQRNSNHGHCSELHIDEKGCSLDPFCIWQQKDYLLNFKRQPQCYNLYPSELDKHFYAIGLSYQKEHVYDIYPLYVASEERLHSLFLDQIYRFDGEHVKTVHDIENIFSQIITLFQMGFNMNHQENELMKRNIDRHRSQFPGIWDTFDVMEFLNQIVDYDKKIKAFKKKYPNGVLKISFLLEFKSPINLLEYREKTPFLNYVLHFRFAEKDYHFASTNIANAPLSLGYVDQLNNVYKIIELFDLKIILTFRITNGILQNITVVVTRMTESTENPKITTTVVTDNENNVHYALDQYQCLDLWKQHNISIPPPEHMDDPSLRYATSDCYWKFFHEYYMFPNEWKENHVNYLNSLIRENAMLQQGAKSCYDEVINQSCESDEECNRKVTKHKECRNINWGTRKLYDCKRPNFYSKKKCQARTDIQKMLR